MGEPNVNYNSKSKRETIRGSKKEKLCKTEEKIETTRGDGPGKERDEICLHRGGLPSLISII